MILQENNFSNFCEKAESIICFGKGKGFDKFFELFDSYGLVNRIRFIVDNEFTSWGKTKIVQGKEIPIVSPKYFLENIGMNDCGLISFANKQEFMKQYKGEDALAEFSVFYYRDIMSNYCTKSFKKVKIPKTLQRNVQPIIPKIINYCWFGKGEIPYENRVWMESWEKYCPDYEIRRWDESNYDVTKNQYMKEAYEAKRWGFATDYARLDIIYGNGGIYLDTDVELLKSLDELLYQEAFMGWEDGLRVASGLGFGAEKQFPLLKEMYEDYNERKFILSDGKCDLTACPCFQTEVLLKHGLIKNGEYQIVDGMAILPVTYLCGKPSYLNCNTRSEHTIGVHQFQASWSKKFK